MGCVNTSSLRSDRSSLPHDIKSLPSENGAYIYIMRCSYPGYRHLVKIGMTINMRRRVRELNDQMLDYAVWPIYFVSVPPEKMRAIEAELHHVFGPERVREDREWFKIWNKNRVVREIEKLVQTSE